MKKVISNYSGKVPEVAKRVMYSLKVLTIGLFIPASFIFGITYKRHIENAENNININQPNNMVSGHTINWFSQALPDQNS